MNGLMAHVQFLNLLIEGVNRRRKIKPDMVKGEKQFLQANLLCDERRYEEAVVEYQKAIKLGLTDDKLVYNNLGVAYDSLGHHHNALECYRNSIRIDPNYEVA
ncbi:MAG: tetratricopeptide repeat protein [Thermoplasmata archaeon]